MNESGELHKRSLGSDEYDRKSANRPLLDAILNAILPSDKDQA
jgi:hypothetical protein